MLTSYSCDRHAQQGVTMIEVLITIVILAFGLLGLAGLQSKLNVGTLESFERAQAVVLLSSLSERIKANNGQAANYVTADPIGTGDNQPTDCSTINGTVARDICEWSNALKGASESQTSGKVGAMTGARGCVTQIQAANPATGICTPGIYRVTVVWQGNHPTKAPSVTCANGTFGDDAYRRAISTEVAVGLPSCE